MPKIVYKLKSRKNDGLAMSPSDLLNLYFFGVPIKSQDGKYMSEKDLAFYIEAATDEIEGFLNIKLNKQIIAERLNYSRDDFRQWGFLPTSFPVEEVIALEGFINTTKQVTYPKEWLSVKEINVEGLADRSVNLVPAGETGSTNSVVYSGITPHVGLYSSNIIPNYWQLKYCTGFIKIPADILNVIGKLAAINLFHIQGDLILGAGIASQSIGIDGLSQSISTTSSATNAGYGARITGYLSDLKLGLPRLKAKYDGLRLTCL